MSPRFHEVNPGRDPSTWYQSHGFENVIKIWKFYFHMIVLMFYFKIA